MPAQPTLAANDLLLRPMTLADAGRVQELAGDELIADTTANIPHPYPDGEAERWLKRVAEQTATGEQLSWAITAEDRVVGCVSLMHITGEEAELGYWVGVPYWGSGIATTAVRSVLACGFEQLGLERIHARVLSRNKASARVLLRLGFIHTGNESTTCGYRGEEAPTDYYELRVKRVIRPTEPRDAESLAVLYNYYVENTVTTFEADPIDSAEMGRRVSEVQQLDLPWLVLEEEGVVIGYACAVPWKSRAAYQHSVESTIYLAPELTGAGRGVALYSALMEQLKLLGVHCVLAGIAQPNEASVGLHEKLGFRKVAHLADVGRKFDRWVDLGYWQRVLD